MKTILTLVTSTLFVVLATTLSAREWTVDHKASSLGFTVDSRIGVIPGEFHKWKFEGKIPANLQVTGKIIIDISSIDTKNKKRDDHLRDPDFFEVDKYPTAVFTFEKVDVDQQIGRYTVKGKLKIRGIEKPVLFKLKEISKTESTLKLKTLFIIDRKDFGITYNSFINPIEDDIVMKIQLVLNKN